MSFGASQENLVHNTGNGRVPSSGDQRDEQRGRERGEKGMPCIPPNPTHHVTEDDTQYPHSVAEVPQTHCVTESRFMYACSYAITV